jgi:hypothetical protein
MKTFSIFITEASEKSSQDSLGKLHETLVGRALNNGKFSEHHRSDEGTPEEVHNRHAKSLYGPNYKNHPAYKNAVSNAEKAAADIKSHLKKHGITKIKKVAWTSQPGDHEKETGVKDPNSTADVIVTGHNGKQAGVSLKVGKTKTPNYKNPGVETYEGWSGKKLKHLNSNHVDVLAKHGNPSHEQYKAWRDSSKPKEKAKAAEIKKSSDELNRSMAAEIHKGLSKKSHKELGDIIRSSTSPETHLPTVVSHTVTGENNSHVSHDVHDQSHHIDHYLSHFEGLHTKPHSDGTSVTIYGKHKTTGKVMPVWSTTVYAGGRPVNKSPRGATTLPSEAKVK